MDEKCADQSAITEEDIFELFDQTSSPILSTTEIADQLPVQRWETKEQLRSLALAGTLKYKVYSPDVTVWWLPEEK